MINLHRILIMYGRTAIHITHGNNILILSLSGYHTHIVIYNLLINNTCYFVKILKYKKKI